MSEQKQHQAVAAALDLGEEKAVQASHLTKQFADTLAVDDLTFTVPAGSIFGFIGPSGCGKTTTIRLLIGHHRPTSGNVWVLGREPSDFDRHIKSLIGYMPQDFVLYPHLTIHQNLRFASSIYGQGSQNQSIQDELLHLFELYEHRGKRVTQISGGMRRRLALAATLLHNPALLFLDEPTAGIDPVLRERLWKYFRALRAQGRTLFVTTQYVGEAAYCDQVAVMRAGKLLMVDTPEGLRRRAFAGEILDVQLGHRIDSQTEHELASIEGVTSLRRIQAAAYEIVAKDASVVIPTLMRWFEANQIEVRSIDEVQLPFDDIFVKLMEEGQATDV
jgi:ABC-2 type transport system ATP-binding protein